MFHLSHLGSEAMSYKPISLLSFKNNFCSDFLISFHFWFDFLCQKRKKGKIGVEHPCSEKYIFVSVMVCHIFTGKKKIY